MPGTAFWVFLTLVVGALIVYLSLLRQVERTVDKTAGTVDKVIDTAKGAAVGLVKLFQPEEVIKTFHEWRELTVASGTGIFSSSNTLPTAVGRPRRQSHLRHL
jgi:hypothetical protein